MDKLKNVPTNLSNLKSKVDILDVDKLLLVPVDLSKLSHVVKNDVYNAKINNIEDKIPDNTNLATKPVLNVVENKIPSVIRLVKKKLTMSQKELQLERKLLSIIMINL